MVARFAAPTQCRRRAAVDVASEAPQMSPLSRRLQSVPVSGMEMIETALSSDTFVHRHTHIHGMSFQRDAHIRARTQPCPAKSRAQSHSRLSHEPPQSLHLHTAQTHSVHQSHSRAAEAPRRFHADKPKPQPASTDARSRLKPQPAPRIRRSGTGVGGVTDSV